MDKIPCDCGYEFETLERSVELRKVICRKCGLEWNVKHSGRRLYQTRNVVEVITHYEKPDEDGDSSEEYYDVEVKLNHKQIAAYGDYYHDKGAEKADAFVDALVALKIIEKGQVILEDKHDR